MWSNEVDRCVIKPSSMVVDRPYTSWNVATAYPISTHTHTHTHIYMFTHHVSHPCCGQKLWFIQSWFVSFYTNSYNAQTGAVPTLAWKCLPHHQRCCYSVRKTRSKGFRSCRSGVEERARASHSQWWWLCKVLVLVGFVSSRIQPSSLQSSDSQPEVPKLHEVLLQLPGDTLWKIVE